MGSALKKENEQMENLTGTNITNKLNKTSHLISVDKVWIKFDSIKHQYGVETPSELVDLAKKSKVQLEDTFVAQLMLIS